MLFNSFEFAVFLPVVFLLYWFVFNRSVKGQNLFIVVASYVFYAWWDWRFLGLIVFTSLCSYASGLLIDKYRETPRKAKLVSSLNIVVNLLILGVFKYYDFFATSFANAFLGGKTDGLLLKLALPVGISFYTFKALSYSIDVYRQKMEPTRDMVQFLAFVGFFPELLAGPIDRASELLPQFAKRREFKYEEGVEGCRQFLWGLFKKVVIADQCAVFVDQVFSSYQTRSGSTLLMAAILYTFQIYGDFSGYSDMAIGTGKLFGIRLMQNFKPLLEGKDRKEYVRDFSGEWSLARRQLDIRCLGGVSCDAVLATHFVGKESEIPGCGGAGPHAAHLEGMWADAFDLHVGRGGLDPFPVRQYRSGIRVWTGDVAMGNASGQLPAVHPTRGQGLYVRCTGHAGGGMVEPAGTARVGVIESQVSFCADYCLLCPGDGDSVRLRK